MPLVCVFLFASPCPAAQKVELLSLPADLDLNCLVPLLNRGEITSIMSKKDGELKQVTLITIVNATPAKTWAVVNDYDHYNEFMTKNLVTKVIGHDGADTIVAYYIELPGPNFKYTLRHHPIPPNRIDAWPENDKGDIKTGAYRWEFFPYAEGTKTFLVYTLYTDIRDTSWIIRLALRADPSIEHMLNSSSAFVHIRSIKKRAEE